MRLTVRGFESGLDLFGAQPHLEALRVPPGVELLHSYVTCGREALITQEIPRDLGALCEELGTKIKSVFLMLSWHFLG